MRSFVYLQPGEHSTWYRLPRTPRYDAGQPGGAQQRTNHPPSQTAQGNRLRGWPGLHANGCNRSSTATASNATAWRKTEGDMNLLGTMRKGELKLGNVHASTSYLNLVTRPGVGLHRHPQPRDAHQPSQGLFLPRRAPWASVAGRRRKPRIAGQKGSGRLPSDDLLARPETPSTSATTPGTNASGWARFRKGRRRCESTSKKTLGGETAKATLRRLVNTTAPEESRALLGPLSAESGGWGRLNPLWKDVNDAGYAKMRDLVLGSIEPMKAHDVNGTCDLPNCECRSCWVRKARAEYREKVAGQAAETGNR